MNEARAFPPGPRSFLPLGSTLAFRRNPLAFMESNAKRYGDLVHFRLGHRHAYQLNHPDLVQDFLLKDAANHLRGPVMQRARTVLGVGLLTAEEPLHTRQRRLMQPAFHRERILRYCECMLEEGARLSGSWRHASTIDLHCEMLRLTLRIVGRSLFITDTEEHAAEIAAAVTSFMSIVNMVFLPFPNLVLRLPIPSMVRFRRAIRCFDAIVMETIERRIRSGLREHELLSMLLEAHQGEEALKDEGSAGIAKQVRDECVTLILAGHETIANALTYTVLLLGDRPEVAAKLRAEVESVTGGALLAPEHFEKLIFTRAVLAESMRLYPPVWILARTLKSATSIQGYPAKAGTILFTSQYVLHRDERFYREPLEFQPERFLAPDHPRFAYFPFGAGPRQCIGEGFAWAEGVLILATLLRSWELIPLSRNRPSLDPAITLRPRSAVMVRLLQLQKC